MTYKAQYLIESLKHADPYSEVKTWWGPDRTGYTEDINKAGRYHEEDAKEICARSNINRENSRMWSEDQVLGGVAGKLGRIVYNQ